jgi:hypothetical protein
MAGEISTHVSADRNDAPATITRGIERTTHENAGPSPVSVILDDNRVHKSHSPVLAVAVPEYADQLVGDEEIEPTVRDVVLDANRSSQRSGRREIQGCVIHVTMTTPAQ